MLNISARRQLGLSLVELMVGSAVGLIVLTAVLTTYVAIARGSGDILASAKLHAELRAAMDLLVHDIRRAGSWTALFEERTGEEGSALPNPYTQRAGSLVTDINILDGGKAIQFSFNGSFLGADDGSVFGYRFSDKAIKVLQCNINPDAPTACNTGSLVGTGWEKLTDDNTVILEDLSFMTKGSSCHNWATNTTWVIAADSTTPACDPAASGYAATSGNRLLEKRLINVKLEGRLKERADFIMRLEQAVYVANDRSFPAP